ncbi:ADP-ribose pyrophosphatase YjhB, NUDIX family [Modicisalibacter ilicicola DSM 19980]|uniref:ADP-ribose pyrophosphatase YjhB, NUDIX family n=1 Tax=Modicisalibacter ilicicola DSM 19980 TaxID=1121942 RepID=A0A1M4Y9M7_9GAMM|nr:NUDIX hydrolase [Halomonas ilicicola]SHF02349.1 ADP-ribose pyrophosphatase YjhB, NUDIX family [Halomonas ilicicola DSM 19980]
MKRWTPRVAVASVIERSGRYLMVEEDRGGPFSLFNQPAGHLEPGERLTQAAVRETQEEAAWQVAITDYLGLYIFTARDGLVFHSHAFVGLPLARLGTPLDKGIVAAHWLTLDEIDDLERAGRLRSPLVMQRLRDLRSGRLYPLDVIRER